MAGKNFKVPKNKVLFKAGDPSDGMYLVRVGEMAVYLEKDGSEVTLAKVPAGGMIGEMALFDNKPRSASVKACADSEVTLISNDDFKKLMRQIPKWFVGLMVTLSTRLRSTNERLQTVESKQKQLAAPFTNVLKVMHVLNLLYHSNGIKEGKEWFIETKSTRDTIAKIFVMNGDEVMAVFNALASGGLISHKKDGYNNNVLAIANRGSLGKFIAFLSGVLEAKPDMRGLAKEELTALELIKKSASESAYDSFSISLGDVAKQLAAEAITLPDIEETASTLALGNDALILQNMGGNQKGFKVNRKEIGQLHNFHIVLNQLASALF